MRFYRSSPSVYTVAFAFGVGRQAADRLTPSKAEQCGAKNIFIPPPRGALAAAKSRRPLLPMLGRTEGTAAAAAPSKKRRMPEEERADGGAPSGKRRKNVRGDASNASAGKRTKTAGEDEEVHSAKHARRGEGGTVTQQPSGEGGPADILMEAAAHILLEVGGREYGGKGRCEHQRERSKCKDCGGSGICEHQRVRSTCKDCGGGSFCEHQRRRSTCKDCGGGSICQHQRVRSKCKDCRQDKEKASDGEN